MIFFRHGKPLPTMNPKRNNALFSAQATLEALRSSIRLLAWGMVGVLLFYLGSGITVIAPNEVGLILRFGELTSDVHQPGLLIAFPSPVDEVLHVPVKSIQEVPLDLWSSVDDNNGQGSLNPTTQFYTLTGDANIIRARFVARYQVSDPRDYVFSAKDRDALRDAILYSTATTVLSSMSVEDTLTARKEYIGQEVMRLAQIKMDQRHLGIQLLAFETREINPPASVVQAFQAVISAKVEATTLVEEASAYQARIIPDAQAQAYRMQQDADSYAKQLVAKAEGESTSYTELEKEYLANPDLVRTRLQNEMIGTVIPRVKIATLMPGGSGDLRIFMVPQKGQAPIMGGAAGLGDVSWGAASQGRSGN